jgi:hypothetical protein
MCFQGFASRTFKVASLAAASMHNLAITDIPSKHGVTAATTRLEARSAEVVIAISADVAVPVEVERIVTASVAADNKASGGRGTGGF